MPTALVERTRRADRAATTRGRRNLLYPLDAAYRQAGLASPAAAPVEPLDLPLPFRTLLVHERDMTVTLEQHWGGRVVLRVLSVFMKRSWYFRRVILAHEYSGRPVEMGAIRIDLQAFAPRVRALIAKNDVPLGRLLRENGVDYRSRPRLFFSVTPNSEMMAVFWMREPRALYGRRTEVLLADRKVGDIVEILPPA